MELKIAPSILSADFGRLNEEIAIVEPYSDIIHVDVMDGHFVPNISFGAPVMKWITSDLPQDVHLMIENPERYFADFVKAGGDRLIVHEEACPDLKAVLQKIVEAGAKPGVSIKPKTSVEAIKEILDLVDIVLVMTVEPGFSGQKFMDDMLPKVRQLREMGFERDICVDGGVDNTNVRDCVEAGANVLVSASYIFGSDDKVAAVKSLRV